jgi:hypothetical protein
MCGLVPAILITSPQEQRDRPSGFCVGIRHAQSCIRYFQEVKIALIAPALEIGLGQRW